MRFTVRDSRWLAAIILALCWMVNAVAQTATTTTKSSVQATNVIDIIGDGKIDWSTGELRARGTGFAPKFAQTPGQITALAREAAIVAAERNLLKVINGVQVSAETTVENLIITQDTIKTQVKGLLRGAVIVSEKPFGDQGYEIVLAVNIVGGKTSLARSIDLADQFKTANPAVTILPTTTPQPNHQPTDTTVVPTTGRDGYTGLVIDCRGLGLSRSMCPRIVDQTNTNIWSTLTISADLVNERGIAGFYQSIDDPTITERVGKHPLVVKALRANGGKVFKTDAVISPADTELIHAENTKTMFLEKLNVAFLVDKGA